MVWAGLRLNQATPTSLADACGSRPSRSNSPEFPLPRRRREVRAHGSEALQRRGQFDRLARPGPLGIDPTDPAGKDDVVTTTLAAPVNRPISLALRSKDVIHDFYVPALRLKYAVPGMSINIHFTATREGRYEIACAELGGRFHHQMRANLDVKSPRDYEEWLKKNSK